MNLFFFVYHEIEFHNYFPTAMELKKKNKDTNIFFIFTNKKNYESIIETKYLHSKLKKKFNILVLRSSGNKILQKFITLQNYIHFFLKFIFLKICQHNLCLTYVKKDIKLKTTTNHVLICFN